jgi:hypothetical protein
MDTPPPSRNSYLFTIRLWVETVGAGQVEWRGRLQHVLSGEVRYFRDWPSLIAQIEKLLALHQDDSESGGAVNEVL